MSCTNRFPSVAKKDIENCLVTLDFCDDIMTCSCCCYFLERHKQNTVEEIIDNLSEIPRKITRIKIPLYPLPANKFYYSFDGLSTIVYNLLKTSNPKQKKTVEKHQAFLKIYYEKNSLFNVPVIQIELLFMGELKPKAIDEYWKTLKAEVLFFTGSVGDIDVIDVSDLTHLEELFRIPLLFGYPEFKEEGIYKEHGFTKEQIKEMNYLHSMQLQPMEMKKVINDNTLDLFTLQRDAIISEIDSSDKDTCDIYDGDIIDAIFGKKRDFPYELTDEDTDELPF